MRVPTLHTATRQFEAIEQRMARQSQLSDQMATGLRIARPSDDPLAASQAELARSHLARLAQDQRAAGLAQGLLSTAEGALGSGVSALQAARELLVAAGNDSYAPADRQALGLQLRGLREALRSVATTADGSGGFVFNTQGADADADLPAFGAEQRVGEGGRYAATVDARSAFGALPQGNGIFITASAAANTGSGWIAAGRVGDPALLTGHRYAIDISGASGALAYAVRDLDTGLALGPAQALSLPASLSIDGQQVRLEGQPNPGDRFELQPAGRQGVFDMLDDAIASLEDASLPAHLRHERLQRSLTNMDRALDAFSMMRSQVGTELQRVDDAARDGQAQALATTARRSQLQDADLAQAVSQMHTNQAALEAALKAYSGMGQMSLVRLLP